MKTQEGTIACIGLLLMGWAPMVHAYGGVGKRVETYVCQAPTFTRLLPERETEVASFSEFSFMTSNEAKMPTLVVKVNGQPVRVSAEQTPLGLQVAGKLAQPITEPGFVLLSAAIDDATGGCPGRIAYRVKVLGSATGEASEQKASVTTE